MKEQSDLYKKRQVFRKQIRRDKLDQMFKKIRVLNQEKLQTQESMAAKIQTTLWLIQQNNYYFSFCQIDRNQICDSQTRENQKILFNLHEEQLKQPDLQVRKMLQNKTLVERIYRKWAILYKWDEQCAQVIETIVKNISESLSNGSYIDKIINFMLSLIQTLIMANKVILLKRIVDKQTFLIGKPEEFYRSILRRKCHNILINLTSTQTQILLLPFLRRISNTIKISAYFLQVYLNIFLTGDIPIRQKFQIYNDFLELLQINKKTIYDNDSTIIKTIYAIFGTSPHIIKKNISSDCKSVTFNLRCTNIVAEYLDVMDYKIEQFYAKDTHGQEFGIIIHILNIMQFIFAEEHDFISRIIDKPNIIKFLINRIKKSNTIPEIKCLRLVFRCLSNLCTEPHLCQQIFSMYPILQIELLRVFQNILKCLFAQKQGCENQCLQFNQECLKFNSELQKLQFECLKQTTNILKLLSSIPQYCQKFIENGLLGNLMFIYESWHQMRKQRHLKQSKDDCLEIICSMVYLLAEKQTQKQPFQPSGFERTSLESLFFVKNTSLKSVRNVFEIFLFQLQQMGNQAIAFSILSKQILLNTILKLLDRIYYETTSETQQTMQQFSQNPCIWTEIYNNFRITYQIPRILQDLQRQNRCKILCKNRKIQQLIENILRIVDSCDHTLGMYQKDLNGNKPIELQI